MEPVPNHFLMVRVDTMPEIGVARGRLQHRSVAIIACPTVARAFLFAEKRQNKLLALRGHQCQLSGWHYSERGGSHGVTARGLRYPENT